jgi:hypothetical protein
MHNDEFEKQLAEFVGTSITSRPEFQRYYRYPCLSDDSSNTLFDSHYIYHLSWAVKKILDSRPVTHCDVSSSLNFCTTICHITPTTFIDLRPAAIFINNLHCRQGDLTDDSQWVDNQFPSLSCMHVIEHIGLGRYGDILNVNGDVEAMLNLRRSVKIGGQLLLVVPVGRPSVYFNAHRVYSAAWVNNFFAKSYRLAEFYLIPDDPNLSPITNCTLSESDKYNYACGCFEFIRER